jgi:hypothetical protein
MNMTQPRFLRLTRICLGLVSVASAADLRPGEAPGVRWALERLRVVSPDVRVDLQTNNALAKEGFCVRRDAAGTFTVHGSDRAGARYGVLKSTQPMP